MEKRGHLMKLSKKEKLAYSSAGIGDAAAYSLVGTYLMFFLTTVAHVDPAPAGTIIAIGSIWDVVCSLISGYVSDHSNSRLGRRKPFLLAGATTIAVSCSLLFNAFDASPAVRAVYYAAMVLIFWTGFSTFFVPYLALGAEITDDYNERTKLRSLTYGFNIFGTFLGVVLPSAIVDVLTSSGFTRAHAWHLTCTLVGIAAAATIYITVFFLKEKKGGEDNPLRSVGLENLQEESRENPKRTEQENQRNSASLADMLKGYAGVMKLKPIRYLLAASIFYLIANTVYGADRLYYYTFNLNFDAAAITTVLLFTSVIGLFFTPVIMTLTRWFDKRSLLILMMLVSALPTAAARITGITTLGGMLLFTFLFCIGSAAYWQLMPAMIYDICEYDELETGNRREGSIVSLLSVAEAFSQAIAIQLLGIVLQLAGFDGEAATQSAGALGFVELSLTVIPAAFMLLTVVMVYFYPITKKKFEEIQQSLKKH